ncbi:MAG: hypothetical protein ACYC2W_07140 [Desulfurivibrionaceae bacterium]
MKETQCKCQTTATGNAPTTATTIDIPADLFKQLQETASLTGTDQHSLLISYLRQGLSNSGTQLKLGQFTEHARGVLKKHGIQANVIEEIFTKFLY